MKNKLLTALFALLLCIVSVPCFSLEYFFTEANTIGTWSGDTTMPGYGSVEITRTAEDWIKFEVTANSEYFLTDPAERSGLTWDKFYFNFNPDKTLDTSAVVVNSGGTWNLVYDQNVSSFGLFDFGVNGTSLPFSVDPLEFTIQDTSLELLDFVYPNLDDGNYFAGHLRRFGDGNEDSIYLAVVPEPGTLLLLGSGLGGIMLYRRKRAS